MPTAYKLATSRNATAAFSPEAMQAHAINGPTYAHAINATDGSIAELTERRRHEDHEGSRREREFSIIPGKPTSQGAGRSQAEGESPCRAGVPCCPPYSQSPSSKTGLLPLNRASAATRTLEFVGIGGWLNTEGPLTVAGLRGKVVLVEFCTYTCINWRRTLPYVNRWDSEYGKQGLQIVGVHTPEFGFERNRPNVESAMRELGVRYPIAQDNAFQTWRAWGNEVWPAFYLLDRNGQIRLVRVGEGHAHEMEDAIRGLLGLARAGSNYPTGDADLSRIQTPEMYFGSLHPTPQDHGQSPREGEAVYTIAQAGSPNLHEYQLDGRWAREEEALVLRSSRGRVRVRFSAAKLQLIAGAPQPASVRVSVDGGADRTVEIRQPTLYTGLFNAQFMTLMQRIAPMPPKAMRWRASVMLRASLKRRMLAANDRRRAKMPGLQRMRLASSAKLPSRT